MTSEPTLRGPTGASPRAPWVSGPGRPRSGTWVLASVAGLLFQGCAPAWSRIDTPSPRALSRATELSAGRGEPQAADDDSAALLSAPLDAERAVRVALLNNQVLRAQLRELGIAYGRWWQAGLVDNPVIEIEALPERNTAYEVRAEYELSSLIVAPLRARAAEADFAAERHALAASVVELAYKVRTAVYDLQGAEQRLSIARRALDTLAASREAAEALHAAGNVAAIAVATEVAAHERARVQLQKIELEASQLREELLPLLGVQSQPATLQLGPGLAGELAAAETPAAPDDTERRAVEANHALLALRSRAHAADRRVVLSRVSGWLPDIVLDVHGLSGDPEGDRAGAPWRFGAGVSVSVPLFDRQQGASHALEAQRAGLAERYRGLESEIRAQARVAVQRSRSAYDRVQRYEQVLIPAQQALRAQTQLHYNAMQVGVFELLRARREELDVQLAYVDTLQEYWRATAAVQALRDGASIALAAGAIATQPLDPNSSKGEH